MRPKIRLENKIWLCYDSITVGKGSTPHESWLNYKKKKELDKLIEIIYNYELG